MTIGNRLRRVLARICSANTMSRIVDPILADMRWESGRATLRGYAALFNALLLHAVMSLPRSCVAVWSDDDYAITRAAGFVAIAAVVAGAVLIALPLWRGPQVRSMSVFFLAVLLMPQAFAVSLPLAITVAVPLALRRLRINARLIRRTLLLSGGVAMVTLAVLTWGVPDANQAFRVATYRAVNGSSQVTIIRGANETGWTKLRRQIEDLRVVDATAAARLEYAYQLRLAIGVAAVPLGLAGLAIAVCGLGRRRPVLTGIGVLSAYWVVMQFEESAARRLITTGGFFPEYLCPWIPNAILLIAATALLFERSRIQPLSPSSDAA